MTDKKQDLRAEIMALVDRYARRFSIDDFDTLRTIRTGIEANTRALTARIAELEAQLEAVGAGGVGALIPKSGCPQEPFGYLKAEPFGWTDCAESDEGAIALHEAPQPQQIAEPAVVGPDWYHAECDDPDRSGFYREKSDALTQVDEHGGYVTELFAGLPPQQIAEPASKALEWAAPQYDERQSAWCLRYERETGFKPLMHDYENGLILFHEAAQKSLTWFQDWSSDAHLRSSAGDIPGGKFDDATTTPKEPS